MGDFFRKYLLPGFVFEAAVIGGGYATGRELVEFFWPAGPRGGLLAMLVSMIVWSIVLAVCFELARRARTYDYRSFFKLLLGPGWIAFEIAYLLLIVLVFAVMGAAAGEIVHSLIGAPKLVGVLLMIAGVAAVLFYSNAVIEKFLSLSVGYLYVVYIALVVWSIASFGDRITANLQAEPIGTGWFLAGAKYAGYNIAAVPAVLFCIRHLSTRREAIGAGLLAGPLGMAPAVALYLAMAAFYGEMSAEALPSAFLLAQLNAPWFEWAFQLAVLLTLVDTGIAFLHAVNERVATHFQERSAQMPAALRPALATAIMILSVFAATAIGLIDLIAKGYGALTWAFIVVLIIPVLTIGVWKTFRPAPAS